jgi:DNA-binding IclR family transcriptional regulator
MARAAPAASRAVAIVAFLTAHPSRGFTISELVDHLGMNIASAHATLAVLSDGGFVVRDSAHRTYRLGPALVATGRAALDQHPAVTATIAEAEVLGAELDTEVHVTALAGRDLVMVARCGRTPPPGRGNLGNRTPLLAPLGIVYVAWAAPEVADEWIERSGAPAEVAHRYRAVLAETRANGFSVNGPFLASAEMAKIVTRLRSKPVDEAPRRELGRLMHGSDDLTVLLAGRPPGDLIAYKAIAAPVFDPTGRALLAISVLGPEHPVPVEEVFDLGRRLVHAATIAMREDHGRFPEIDAHPALPRASALP